jgi:crotonobetainyl-CoA:carnitine CoA-transferase CaiB-like acyl-CoA transferase
MLGFPVRFRDTPLDPSGPAPTLGEQGAAILTEAGYSPNQIEDLITRGVV